MFVINRLNQSINILFYVCSHRGDIRQNKKQCHLCVCVCVCVCVCQELEKGLTRDCLAGSDDINYYKNRFTSILPCECVADSLLCVLCRTWASSLLHAGSTGLHLEMDVMYCHV